MTDLATVETRLKDLRNEAKEVVGAQKRIECQRAELVTEIKAVDTELSRLALADATGDTEAKARFLERFRHQEEMFALQNMIERAKMALVPLLNDKSRSGEIWRLENIVTLAQHHEKYDCLLKQLNEKYDEYLEQDLIKVARHACIATDKLNADVYKYHCKHGISTNRYDPLRLEPQRPRMQI